MKRFKNLAIALFLLLAACTLNAQSAADEQSIRAFIDQSEKIMYTADVDQTVAMYGDEAMMVVYNGQKVVGKAAIKEFYTAWYQYEKPQPGSFNMQISNIRFLNANLALVLMDTAGKSVVNGQTIEWKAEATLLLSRKNGQWKVELDQATPIMPAQGN